VAGGEQRKKGKREKSGQRREEAREEFKRNIDRDGGRTGFSLSRALFRKKMWGPHLRRQTLFFLDKNWRPFLVITVAFTWVSPIVCGRLLRCKKIAAPLVEGPFLWGPSSNQYYCYVVLGYFR